MTWGQAFLATRKRAAIFGLVFVVMVVVLDSIMGRSVDWGVRGLTIVLATLIYWVFLASMARRSQG